MNFKQIKIGNFIQSRFLETGISMERACNFLKCNEKDIHAMFQQEDLSADVLLKWSKLLEYDFFRIYSQHLIMYSPQAPEKYTKCTSRLPKFRKNVYTKEIIEFILELIETEKKSKKQIIDEYQIPKTTLYKWINKFSDRKQYV